MENKNNRTDVQTIAQPHSQTSSLTPRINLLVILLLLIAGAIGSWWTIVRADQSMRQELLQQSQMIARSINVNHIKEVKNSEIAIDDPDYFRLKEQLAAVKSANDKCRFIYLMDQQSNGSIIFLVDNEHPDSEDYSAPGDIFEDASSEFIGAFEKGEAIVEGPVVDQWGTWVSALVPIYDHDDETFLAILGMDIDALTWRKDVAARAALPIVMMASSLFLIFLIVMLWRNRNLIRQNQLELLELKNFNERIVQNAAEGIIVTDQSGIIEFANPTLEKMLGYNSGELNGTNWLNFVPAAMQSKALKADARREKGHYEKYELNLQHINGTPVPVQISASPRYDSQTGEYCGSLAILTDLTDLLKAEKAIRESEEKYRLIFECSPLGVLHFDHNGVITDCNENFVKIIGSSRDALFGLDMLKLPDKKIVKSVQGALMGRITTYEGNYKSMTADKITPVRAIFAPVLFPERNGIKAESGIGIIEDITERKEAEDNLIYMSFHDKLTNLYNRHFLEEEIKRLDTERQLPISIIMADLNGLKLVNDTYGHIAGDQLLCAAADIIRTNSRDEDIIARWGGDEFVLLLPRTDNKKAELICRRITESCKSAIIKNIPVSIALGVATKNGISISLVKTLVEAEDNMYKQKLTESRSTKSAVLEALLKTLAAKSYETEKHTRNMQEIAFKIGEKLGLPESELNRLALLITLHDIGKINLPEDILTKSGKLSPGEWEIIKKHPEIGHRIAMATEEFAHVAEDILSHHEWWDGAGYPRGLKGSDIPLLARITAVADAYEVMSNGRPYRKAMLPEQIIVEIKRCTGTQFDPKVVEIFLSI